MIYNNINDLIKAIEYSFKYPFSNSESKYGSSIQGFSSFILSPFIIPLAILIGYLLNIREYSLKGDNVPKFESYDELMNEGFKGLLVYSPIITIILLSFSFSLLVPQLLIFCILALYIWPAASIMYAIKRDYKEVYTQEFFMLITNKSYIKSYVIYLVLLIILSFLTIMLSLITFGIGLIVLIPILLYSRPSFWGYIIRKNDNILTTIE